MGADAGVEPDAVDDGLCVQAFHLCISIEFIEVADAQGEVGVGEEFHGLGLFHSDEERGDIFLDGGLLQQSGEQVGFLGEPLDIGQRLDGVVLLLVFLAVHHLGDADDDAGGVEVVVEGLALAEELG